jgi:hypothetical protein
MLFFIHIPKTAGTSVFGALHQMVPGRVAWYTPQNTPAQFFATPGVRTSISIYGGHFDFGQIRNFLAYGDKVYSIVRNPVERVFSYFNHLLYRDPNHPHHEYIKNLRIIAAASALSQFKFEITNAQCWYLSNIPTFEGAKNVIESYDVHIYRISQLGRLLQDMASDLGIGDLPQIGHENVAQNDYKLHFSAEEREFVNRLNEEDWKLFKYYGISFCEETPSAKLMLA